MRLFTYKSELLPRISVEFASSDPQQNVKSVSFAKDQC